MQNERMLWFNEGGLCFYNCTPIYILRDKQSCLENSGFVTIVYHLTDRRVEVITLSLFFRRLNFR